MEAMAKKSSLLEGKFSTGTVLLMSVLVFCLIAFWQNRMIFFEEDPLIWLGLKADGEGDSYETGTKAESSPTQADHDSAAISAKLQTEREAEGPLDISTSFGKRKTSSSTGLPHTVTLKQTVSFTYTKASGEESSFKAPKGSIVKLLEAEGSKLRVSLMGREGWIPRKATNLDGN